MLTTRQPLREPLLNSIQATNSEPTLPQEPGRLTGRKWTPPTLLGRKAMSYPFSQQEVLAEASAGSSGTAFETFSIAARRLAPTDISELLAGATTVVEARAAVYKRMRPDELLVPEEGPSWQQVAMTIATVLVGAGVLSLPYALRRAGWSAMLMIAAASTVASYTAKMLVWSFNTLNERKSGPDGVMGNGFVATYDQLSEEIGLIYGGPIGGRVAGMLMKGLTILECYGCAVCYVVLHATNWPQVLSLPPVMFNTVPASVLCASVWALLMAPLMLIKVRHLTIFGSLGLLAIATLLVVSVAAPVLNGEPQAVTEACTPFDSSVAADQVVGSRELVSFDGLGVALGLVLFCFGGHATLPDIYARMTALERPKFDAAVNMGCAIACALYALLGGVGYFFYGNCAADTLTFNLIRSSPVLGSVATICILSNTFLTFPNFCAPVVRILTEAMHTADAVASLEADVVPPTEEQLHRMAVRDQLESIHAKLDALGSALGALAVSSAVQLPREAMLVLRAEQPAELSVDTTSDFAHAVNGAAAKKRATFVEEGLDPEQLCSGGDARRLSPGFALFETMSTRSLLVRLALVVGAATLAVSVPNFGFVVALMGAFTTMLVSFILPTAFYLAVHWDGLSRISIFLCAAVILLGFAGMFVGLYNTLAEEEE